MRQLSILPIALAATAASAAQDAPVVKNAPDAYTLVQMPFAGAKTIQAEIFAGTAPDGSGVVMTVNINGGDPLPGGPFSEYINRKTWSQIDDSVGFEIHDKSTTEGSDCDSVGGMFDPYQVGDAKCNDKKMETCAVGDISGKHGLCGQVPGCSMT